MGRKGDNWPRAWCGQVQLDGGRHGDGLSSRGFVVEDVYFKTTKGGLSVLIIQEGKCER